MIADQILLFIIFLIAIECFEERAYPQIAIILVNLIILFFNIQTITTEATATAQTDVVYLVLPLLDIGYAIVKIMKGATNNNPIEDSI